MFLLLFQHYVFRLNCFIGSSLVLVETIYYRGLQKGDDKADDNTIEDDQEATSVANSSDLAPHHYC